MSPAEELKTTDRQNSSLSVVVMFKEDTSESHIIEHMTKIDQMSAQYPQVEGRYLHGFYGRLEHICKGYTDEFAPEVQAEIRASPEVAKVIKDSGARKEEHQAAEEGLATSCLDRDFGLH